MNLIKYIHNIILLALCIGQVYSEEALFCYRCFGSSECGIKPDKSILKQCDDSVEENSCFEVVKDDSTMVRGCKSDPTYVDCQNSGGNCIECKNSGCNNLLTTLKRAEMVCHICNTKTDLSCLWTQYDKNVKRCERLLPKYVKEKCYTKKLKDGGFQRGCVFDDDLCTMEDEVSCLPCDESGCNKGFVRAQECIQAVEDLGKVMEGERYSNETVHQKSLCAASEQYYETRGCYVMKRESKLIWGCAVHLQPEILELCKQNGDTCKFCTGNDCKNMKAPITDENGAESLRLPSVLLGFTLVFYFIL